jgi:heat shock protein HslJ
MRWALVTILAILAAGCGQTVGERDVPPVPLAHSTAQPSASSPASATPHPAPDRPADGATGASPAPTTATDRLWGRTFVAVSIAEAGVQRPLLEGTRLKLTFERRESSDGMHWNAGCNTAGAEIVIDADRIDVGPISQTDMGCDEARHAQDAWVADFFTRDPRWRVERERLVLTAGSTVIEFAEWIDPAHAEPSGAAEPGERLWGRAFVSVRVKEGEANRVLVDGTAVNVRFDRTAGADSLGWHAGCNAMGADVQVQGDRLDLGDISATGMGCDARRTEQDEWLFEFFAADPAWLLRGRHLSLWVGTTRIELVEEGYEAPREEPVR